jgi:carbon-monoxide dehydrogenase medium subunit
VIAAIGFEAPQTVELACALLGDDPDARVVSGGTALAILMRQGLVRPSRLVSLRHVHCLGDIEVAVDGSLRLGAMVPLRNAERHPALTHGWPVLAEAFRAVATPRIRNMATVGGGLAHADPAQDPPAAYVALEAQVRVSGSKGQRLIAAQDFFVDYYETALLPGEIVTGLEVPRLAPGTGAAFLKFTPRSVDDYATVSACSVVQLDAQGLVKEARLVLGAAGVKPVVVEVADALVGRPFREDAAREASEQARAVVEPMDDVRGSAAYKRDMAVVFGRRALGAAAARAAAAAERGKTSRRIA